MVCDAHSLASPLHKQHQLTICGGHISKARPTHPEEHAPEEVERVVGVIGADGGNQHEALDALLLRGSDQVARALR